MTGSVCAGCARKSSNLTGCRGTRTPKWPPRRILNRIYALPRGHHDRVLAVGNPVHCQCPATVQHIHTSSRKRDSRKSHGKQHKHCQEFPHEIHLQRDQHCQEHPHPLPALVLGLHLFLYPPGTTPLHFGCWSISRILSCFTTYLDASTREKGPTSPLVPVLFDTFLAQNAMVRKVHFWA